MKQILRGNGAENDITIIGRDVNGGIDLYQSDNDWIHITEEQLPELLTILTQILNNK